MNKNRLSAREQALWHSLKRLGETVLARVGSEIETATGLSGPDFAILSRLEDLGEGTLGLKALMRSLEWEKSRLSHQLTRMEARGLVARSSQEASRAINIMLLPQGATAIAAARPAHAKAVRAVLQKLDEEDGHRLIALMARLEEKDDSRDTA